MGFYKDLSRTTRAIGAYGRKHEKAERKKADRKAAAKAEKKQAKRDARRAENMRQLAAEVAAAMKADTEQTAPEPKAANNGAGRARAKAAS